MNKHEPIAQTIARLIAEGNRLPLRSERRAAIMAQLQRLRTKQLQSEIRASKRKAG